MYLSKKLSKVLLHKIIFTKIAKKEKNKLKKNYNENRKSFTKLFN